MVKVIFLNETILGSLGRQACSGGACDTTAETASWSFGSARGMKWERKRKFKLKLWFIGIYELKSKLLISPSITPTILPFKLLYITPCPVTS